MSAAVTRLFDAAAQHRLASTSLHFQRGGTISSPDEDEIDPQQEIRRKVAAGQQFPGCVTLAGLASRVFRMMSQPASYRIQTKKFGRSQTLRPNFAPIDDEWLYYLLLDPFVAGVPEVPVDWPGVAAPGALYVPEVVGEPGALDAPDVPDVPDAPDVPELELPEVGDESDDDPELLDPFVAGVPEVPVDCPGVAAPGALYVPEVVGDPGAEDAPEDELLDDLSEVTPDEEPELMLPELDFFAPESMAPQAPSAKTHAIGMIHLFIKSSLKNLNEESSGTHHIRAETLCLH